MGLGTFRPVKEENIENHIMHSEHYWLPAETANAINETKKNGGRVIAVGTTSCRTLESVATFNGKSRRQRAGQIYSSIPDMSLSALMLCSQISICLKVHL